MYLELCNQRANLVQLVMAVLTSWNRCCTVVEMKIPVHLHVPSTRHRIADLSTLRYLLFDQ